MATVLVVDDDLAMTESLKNGLAEHGYDVITGHNGREGVDLASEVEPDLILLDVLMPEMDGLEACRLIRQETLTPIIMLTAQGDEEDVIQALNVGADDYLNKPFRLNELAARIGAILRRKQWEVKQSQHEIDRLKQQIMSNVTHELRTPIATIINTLEIVLKSEKQNTYTRQLQYIESVKQNTYTLNRLVDDLLILSQLDDGLTIWRRPILIRDEISRLLKITQPLLAGRQITVHTDLPEDLLVNADQTHFRHALYHLWDNALKFSPQAGHVWINGRTANNRIILTIRDQGPGIPEPLHEKIFERFYQVESGDNRSHSGLGIGLCIARSIARIHEGDVLVENHPGQGSQLHLHLPVSTPDWAV